MSAISPVFPVLEPHHFSDYGFDPQIDFFQVPPGPPALLSPLDLCYPFFLLVPRGSLVCLELIGEK